MQQNLLQVNKGEYSCPLCLQLSNSVIPILPEENKYTLMRPVSPDKQQMVKDLADMMVKRPITPVSKTLLHFYVSIPIRQYTVTFTVVKMTFFLMKNCDILLILAKN